MKNIEKDSESFYQRDKSSAKERGGPNYFDEAKRLLGREFKHLEVFDIFKGLGKEQSYTLFRELQIAVTRAKGAEEKMWARKTWLDQATSRADVYRAGSGPDKSPS